MLDGTNKEASRMRKKITFLKTHFGTSKFGRDEAAKQEFPK
jgi:hypothetical protein